MQDFSLNNIDKYIKRDARGTRKPATLRKVDGLTNVSTRRRFYFI